MKCNKYELVKTGQINLKKSNFLGLIFTLLFISILNNSNSLESKKFNKKNENKQSVISQPYNISNQSISLEISIKANKTFSLPHITDKVDLEIKTLDRKLDTLSKMIENYEKIRNQSVLNKRIKNETFSQNPDNKTNLTSRIDPSEKLNHSLSFRRIVIRI
jgi:hypothetical protein